MGKNPAPKIDQAMILAAGLGTRMRPITDTIPKPLVKVAEKTLLDHALDAVAKGGVSKAVINVHYLADQIESHVSNRHSPKVSISDERAELLDSGGGVKKAMAGIAAGPFFILNADSFWIDAHQSTIRAMADYWDDNIMDMVLLLAKKEEAVGFDGKGDFFADETGRLTRRGDHEAAPYVYAGAIIARAEKFHAISEARFSLNALFDEAIENERLFGFVLDGLWLHVGTPKGIQDAEDAISAYQLDKSA